MKPCGGWGGRARSRVCVWVCVQDVTSSAVALRRAEGKEGKVQGSGMLRIAARGRRRMMAFGFDGFDGFDGWSLDHCDHATDLGVVHAHGRTMVSRHMRVWFVTDERACERTFW